MMTFITKNHKELVLFEKKYEIVGNKTIQFTSTNGAPLSYTQDQYDWVIYTTMLYSTIRVDRSGTILYDRTPSLIINNKHDLIRGYKLSCTNTTDSSSYYGGVSSELTVVNMSYLHYDDICIRNLNNFIRRSSKNSKKKLIRMMYLYDLRNKDFSTFDLLLARLKRYFNLNLLTWSSRDSGYSFDGIKPIYTTSDNRNKSINSVIRYGKQLNKK